MLQFKDSCYVDAKQYHLASFSTRNSTLNTSLRKPIRMQDFIQLCDSTANRPRSIYQYSNMVPRLSGQTSIFGVVFFVSKSLLGIERQKKLEKFAILTRKPRSHVRILIYRTWPIVNNELSLSATSFPGPFPWLEKSLTGTAQHTDPNGGYQR